MRLSLGIEFFLGIEFKQGDGFVKMSQRSIFQGSLRDFKCLIVNQG